MFLKKIKDIRISKFEVTTIRDAALSINELEEQIKSLTYTGANSTKDEGVEIAKLPPFIQVFYYLFFRDLIIPAEKEFCSTYLEWIGGETESHVTYQGANYPTAGIINRMKRSYPSFIRDVHFLYLLEHSNLFESVTYSMVKDYFNGLDLCVKYKGKEVFVSLFIDTSRGKYFKRKKTQRHDYSSVEEIEFNVSFDSMTKCGSIYLLNQSHVLNLERNINQRYDIRE